MLNIKSTLILLILITLASCAGSSAESGSVTVDMSQGKASSCFDTLRDSPETLSLEVTQKGEVKSFVFEGVYLEALLRAQDINGFTRLEVATSDMGDVDITEFGNNLFLAWSESGVDESPMRVMPADAATGNLLIRNVTALIVTR